MKISLKWLSEFFEQASAFEVLKEKKSHIRAQMPLAGLEIGEVRSAAQSLEKVLIAQIKSFEKHPKADRLNVCQVSVGDSEKPLQIVCGAPNVRAGMKVALAPVGAILPGDFAIQAAEIRGVKSFGMLCSEKELGLSQDSQGIMNLPESAPVGSSFVKALGLDDEIWEFELTPDRGDCLSHRGLAREFSRFLNLKVKLPEAEIITSGDNQNEVSLVSVEVTAGDAVLSYGVQLFENIVNTPSPDWLKRRLELLGLKSHGTVVDITNYVLFELGHPVHAFDADKVHGSRLIVRYAKNNEKIKTLDGIERALSVEDLIIADSAGPLALAGLMGGMESSVTEKTQRVLLECAVFDPMVVRSQAKRHKLQTDSSYRFERGVDPALRLHVVGRVALLLKNLSRARKRGAFVEIQKAKSEKTFLNLDLRMFRNVTGIEAHAEDLQKRFLEVEIESTPRSANVLKVEVPSHRFDLKREIDLIEEGARLIGYSQIPTRYPVQQATSVSLTRGFYEKTKAIRLSLLETGLSETKPYAFVSKNQLEKSRLDPQKQVAIENPLSEDWHYLRPALFWGQLSVLSRQKSLGAKRFGCFDTGTCFVEDPTVIPKDQGAQLPSAILEKRTGVREAFHASWALMGPRYLDHWSSDKKQADRKAEVDFYDAKGIFEAIHEVLSVVADPRWRAFRLISLLETEPTMSWIPWTLLHPGRSALIAIPGDKGFEVKGYIGEIHPQKKGELLNLATGFDTGVAIGEIRIFDDIEFETLALNGSDTKPTLKLTASRKFPVVERDIALVIDSKIKAGDLLASFRKVPSPELLEVQCVDRFDLGGDKISLAFRFFIQGVDDTLTDEQITTLMEKIVQEAKKKHGAELR